jgi:hypothetical protein
MPCDYKRYPKDWKQIRARILERAGHKCERCGVPDHAVGYRNESGGFHALRGEDWDEGADCRRDDNAGKGRNYADDGVIDFAEAKEIADWWRGETGEPYFVIVLTVAHLDHDPANNVDANLSALCQQCHLRHDAGHHAKNAARTRQAKKDALYTGVLV